MREIPGKGIEASGKRQKGQVQYEIGRQKVMEIMAGKKLTAETVCNRTGSCFEGED